MNSDRQFSPKNNKKHAKKTRKSAKTLSIVTQAYGHTFLPFPLLLLRAFHPRIWDEFKAFYIEAYDISHHELVQYRYSDVIYTYKFLQQLELKKSRKLRPFYKRERLRDFLSIVAKCHSWNFKQWLFCAIFEWSYWLWWARLSDFLEITDFWNLQDFSILTTQLMTGK